MEPDRRLRERVVPWDPNSTYIQEPPFLPDLAAEPGPIRPIRGARVLAALGDSVTTDHISPAGSIAASSPAGKYLQEHGVAPADFNSYGSRRGNDRVMARGTFANIRIRNLLAAGHRRRRHPALARRRTDADLRRRHEVQGRRRAAGGAGRHRIRHRQQPRLGRQGPLPAGHPGRASRRASSASTAATWWAWAFCRCNFRRARRGNRWG